MQGFCAGSVLVIALIVWCARKQPWGEEVPRKLYQAGSTVYPEESKAKEKGVGFLIKKVGRRILTLFYKAGALCAEKMAAWRVRHGYGDLGKKERICQELVLNRPGKETLLEHEGKRWGTFLLIYGCACLAGFLVGFREPEGIVRTKLERNLAGSGDQVYFLQVRGLLEEDVQIKVPVGNVVLADTEALFEQAYQEAREALFAEGDTADGVRSNLNFQTSFCRGLVKASWESRNSSYIRYDGTVVTEEVPQEGVVVEVRVTFEYEEQTAIYPIELKLLPRVYTEDEQLIQALKLYLSEKERENTEEGEFVLPQEFQGRSLVYVEEADRVMPYQVVLFGLMVGSLVFVLADRNMINQSKEREQQMQMDYPEVVLKLTVLLRAGLTVRAAWERIVNSYLEMRQEGRKGKRYLYEEMLQASLRMQGGAPEGEAYLEFGRRTHLQSCLKLSSLLEQNLKKGSRGLVNLLEAETQDAWNARKTMAKQRGEEAGTKMLIPMFAMLILIMLIIIAPALLSF